MRPNTWNSGEMMYHGNSAFFSEWEGRADWWSPLFEEGAHEIF